MVHPSIVITGLLALSMVVNILFLALVLIKSKDRKIKAAFLFYVIGMVFYQLVGMMLGLEGFTTLWLRLSYTAANIFFYGIFYLSNVFPYEKKYFSFYILSIATAIFTYLSFTDFVIISAAGGMAGAVIKTNYGYPYIAVYYLLMLFLVARNFYYNYRDSNFIGRQKIKYCILGILLTISFIVVVDLLLPFFFNYFGLADFGPIFANVTVAATTYAILRHRLMDINVVVKRSTYFLVLFLITTGPYLMISSYISTHISVHSTTYNLLFSAVFWMTFIIFIDYIKSFLRKLTDRIFFMADYDYDKALSQMGRKLQAVSDTAGIVAELDSELKFFLKTASTGIIMLRSHSLDFCYLSSDNIALVSSGGAVPLLLEKNHFIFIELTKADNNCLIYEEVAATYRKEKQQLDKQTMEFMEAINARLLIASLQLNSVNCVLVLGEKKSGEPYKAKDINLLINLIGQIGLVVSKLFEIEEKSRMRMGKELQEKYSAQLKEKNDLLESKNAQLVDASEKIKKQESILIQQEKLAILGDITASVAHEINTPLLAITLGLNQLFRYTGELRDFYNKHIAEDTSSSLTLLLKGHEDYSHTIDDVRFSLDQIRNQVQNMKSFIKFQEKSDSFNVNVEMETTLNIMNYKLLGDTEIEKELSPAIPEIKGDGALLNQVFMIILKNAVEFRKPDKRVKLRIRTFYDSQRVYIEIEDTGTGIEESIQSQLFKEQFSTKPMGTGLGLLICQDIINQLNGTISLSSTIGVGTIVKISFKFNYPALI